METLFKSDTFSGDGIPRHYLAHNLFALALPRLSLEDVDRILCVAGLRDPFFALSNSKTGIAPFNSWRFHKGLTWNADSSTILFELLRAETTLIVKHAHLQFPALGAFVRSLQEDQFQGPAEVNCYVTPPNAKGLLPHADPRNTFLVQQHGIKRWRVWDRPTDEEAEPMSLNEFGEPIHEPVLDIDLRPGDVLFIPERWCSSLDHGGSIFAPCYRGRVMREAECSRQRLSAQGAGLT
jgi:Cupin superfamily protein